MEVERGLDEVEAKERVVRFTLHPSGKSVEVLLKYAMISGLVRQSEEADKSQVIEINIDQSSIPEERLLLVVEYMEAMKGVDLPKVPRFPDYDKDQDKKDKNENDDDKNKDDDDDKIHEDDVDSDDLFDKHDNPNDIYGVENVKHETEKHEYYNNLDECYSDNYLSGFGDEEFRVTKCKFEVDPKDSKEETEKKRERHTKLMNGWRYPYKGDFNEARKFVKYFKEKVNKTLFLHPGEDTFYDVKVYRKKFTESGKCVYKIEQRDDMDMRFFALACVANWFDIHGLISFALTLFKGSKKLIM